MSAGSKRNLEDKCEDVVAYFKTEKEKSEHSILISNFLKLRHIISCSLRKHPFLLALRQWGHFNVPGGEERGETDVFAGYISCVCQQICAHSSRFVDGLFRYIFRKPHRYY